MPQFFSICENCAVCDTETAVTSSETGLKAEEEGRLRSATKLWKVVGVTTFPSSIPYP